MNRMQLCLVVLCWMLLANVVSAGIVYMPDVVLQDGYVRVIGDGETELSILGWGADGVQFDQIKIGVSSLSSTMTFICSYVNEQGNNMSKDERILEFNVTYSGSAVTFTFTGNNSNDNMLYNLDVDGLRVVTEDGPHTFYTQTSGSDHRFLLACGGYQPDPPYAGSSHYDPSSNTVNLTWSRGNFSNQEIVTGRTDQYATSPSDPLATIWQNSTFLWHNFSVNQSQYFTVWSYNLTTNTFSGTGLDIPWGAIALSCYNESNGSQALTFDIFITNTDGSQVYEYSDATNIHYIDLNNIPFGERSSIQANSDGYELRTMELTLEVNHFYNLSFYLPKEFPSGGTDDPDYDPVNETYAQLYLLRVIDQFNNPIENVEMEIKRYINATGQFQNVSVRYTNPNGYVEENLLPGTYYKLRISKDGYKTNITWFQPSDELTTYEFKLYPEEPSGTTTSFGDICIFNGTWLSNASLQIYFKDKDSMTTDIQFFLYEIYGSALTLIETRSFTDEYEIYWYNTSDLNNSRLHRIILNMNHTTLGAVVNQWVDVLPYHGDDDRLSGDWFDDQMDAAVGDWVFDYTNFFILFLPTLVIILLGGIVHHPGLGVMASGAYLALVIWNVNVNVETVVGTLITLFLLIGIITIISKKGKGLLKRND